MKLVIAMTATTRASEMEDIAKINTWNYSSQEMAFPLLSKRTLSLKPNDHHFSGGIVSYFTAEPVVTGNLCAKIPEMLKIICVLRWLLRQSHQAIWVCIIFLVEKNWKCAEHKINRVLQESRWYYLEWCLQVFFFLHKLLQLILKFSYC